VPGCRRWTICTDNQCLGEYILPALIGKEEQSMRHLPILQLGLRCGTPIGGASLPQAINDKRQTLSASVSKAAGSAQLFAYAKHMFKNSSTPDQHFEFT